MKTGMPFIYEQYSAYAVIARSGGVAVTTYTELDTLLRALVARHSVTPSEQDSIKWVPHEATWSVLKDAETDLLRTIGEMLHNEGRQR